MSICNFTKAFYIIYSMLAVFVLAGCVSVAMEGTQAVKSEVVISQNMDAARAGNAEAQYKVGNAYCCSIHKDNGIYNTETSVEWLCKSARQGYTPAMVKLGKIYSGDMVDGVRLPRRVMQGVVGKSTNLPVAVTWAQLAVQHGDSDAKELVSKLWEDMSSSEKNTANQLIAMEYNAPCQWNQVNLN